MRTRVLIPLLLLSALLWGCGDDAAPPGVTSNNGTTTATNNGTTPEEVACGTSAECAGGVCLLDICRACVEDAACAADPLYGAGAVCDAGVCVPCLGQEGCGCDADTCQGDLVCEGGLCVACTDGTDGCACFGNGTCLDGLRCEGDACAPCPPGEEGCACDAGDACGDGLVCMEDVCVEDTCVAGALDCPCIDEGGEDDPRCDEGLTCSDGGVCAECSNDIEGCPCDEDDACADELVCDEDEGTCRAAVVCADLGCGDNRLCQDPADGRDALCLDACADGFTFNPDTGLCDVTQPPPPNCQPGIENSILADCQGQNRQCVEAIDDASCGACLGGFVEEGGACRPVVTCAGLTCAADNRQCVPSGLNSDATCGACLMGFEDDGGACVEIQEIHCRPDEDGSILADCAGQNRACVEDGNTASCGDCLDGFGLDPDTEQCVQRLCADLDCGVLGRACDGEPLAACGACLDGLTETDPNDPSSPCREALGCDELECADDEVCVERPGQDAFCGDWPCYDINNEPRFDQAFREDAPAGEQCIDCNLDCGGAVEGETGRIWPFTLDASNRCICETEPGYFILPTGDFAAKPCDADGDGWVRSSAQAAFESGDPALIENARCDVRTIDRVVLENEYQQSLTLLTCDEGPVPDVACDCQDGDACAVCGEGRCNTFTGRCDCRQGRALDLYESVRNDDQLLLDAATPIDAPAYAFDGRGRKLRASELTPLTKACVSITGDHNDNGIRDIVEWQGDDALSNADANLLSRFAYFVELHESRYERDLGVERGRLHIQEKSRCELDFPVGYNPATDQGDYWRSCTRNRDVDFDSTGDNLLIGHDFAHFSCTQGAVGCPTPPPLTDVSPDGEPPPHGLCEDGVTLPPADGVWRGMNHTSQFKCVELADVIDPALDRIAEAPHLRLIDEQTDSLGIGLDQFNRCQVACPDDDAITDPECVADCDGQECLLSSLSRDGQPDLPIITCTPTPQEALAAGEVGFVAVRFSDQAPRGCVTESRPDPSAALSEPWRLMCPGYAGNPEAVVVEHNPSNFGRLICGCGFNYGGANCELGCPGDPFGGELESLVHFGGDASGPNCSNGYCVASADPGGGGGREGFWMCGDLSTVSTEGALDHADGWRMRGDVARDGVSRDTLCENDDCTTGFNLR